MIRGILTEASSCNMDVGVRHGKNLNCKYNEGVGSYKYTSLDINREEMVKLLVEVKNPI